MVADGGNLYLQCLMILGGAIVAAPLFKRLGLGTMLGYLAAGITIGPVARLIADGEEFLHFSELGVVFLLFIIGLELKPSRLWALRHSIFGLGAAQVLLCGAALTALAVYLGRLHIEAAIIVGFGLALSSTAFAMQVLEDRAETNQKHGQRAFAILLFQDLAVVPILAIIPALSPNVSSQVSAGFHLATAIAAIAALVGAGRYLINPMFRIIGNTGAREVMIAAALFVVLGSAGLLQAAGLSMAMGAFIAGVLLAESSYRHELEADIEPFRGIFLGLFFVAVTGCGGERAGIAGDFGGGGIRRGSRFGRRRQAGHWRGHHDRRVGVVGHGFVEQPGHDDEGRQHQRQGADQTAAGFDAQFTKLGLGPGGSCRCALSRFGSFAKKHRAANPSKVADRPLARSGQDIPAFVAQDV